MATEKILIYSAEGKRVEVVAKKDGSMDQSSIIETRVESLGYVVPSEKLITLTWGDCQRGTTFTTEFVVISSGDNDVVLGVQALDDLQEMKRGDPVWVALAEKVKKEAKAEAERKKAENRQRQEDEREREKQDKLKKIQDHQLHGQSVTQPA